MNIGLQTISWGFTIDNLDKLCTEVKELGYSGLEFSQPIEVLGGSQYVKALLDKHKMRLAGLAGGSLHNRIQEAAILNPDYLYLDEWDEEAVLQANGITIGLHPHLFKDMETVADAEVYLERYPWLKLILDTAHLYLAKVDIRKALEQHRFGVVSVHLKDWSSEFGESPFQYSRGFTMLGRGILEKLLTDTVELLKSLDFQGWVIVEQETPHGDPLECARISRDWLREHDL